MKNLLKRRIKLLCIAGGLVSLTVVSCSKDDVESNDDTNVNVSSYEKVDPNNPVVKILVSRGWNINKIQKLSNGDFSVGDISFSGNIKDYNVKKQAREELVNDYRNISVFVHSSITQEDNTNTDAPNEDNWTDATKNAITIWNSVPDSGLRFTEALNIEDADILIFSDFGLLADGTLGQGRFPSDGNAGRTILINLDYNNNESLDYDIRFDTMVHELGHNIGYRHTDWQGQGEGNDTLVNIPGTPTGDNPDPDSVMNAFVDAEFNGLSFYDKVALKFMYPN